MILEISDESLHQLSMINQLSALITHNPRHKLVSAGNCRVQCLGISQISQDRAVLMNGYQWNVLLHMARSSYCPSDEFRMKPNSSFEHGALLPLTACSKRTLIRALSCSAKRKHNMFERATLSLLHSFGYIERALRANKFYLIFVFI